MNPLIHTLHVAVPTAFDTEERLDPHRTIAHILYLQEQGIRSFLICGSTGEQHSVTYPEKISLLNALAAENRISKEVELLFGVAAIRYKEAQALALHIAQLPCISGILLGFPPYICPTQTEAIAYGEGLIHAANKPVILYNNPRRTGFDLSLESLYALAKDPRVVGLKEAGDVQRIASIKSALSIDFRFYAGGEQELIQKVRLGFNGLSSMAGNLCPHEIMQCWQVLSHGENLNTDDPAWHRILSAAAGDPTQRISYLPWLKAQMTVRYANFGNCRKPLGWTNREGADL